MKNFLLLGLVWLSPLYLLGTNYYVSNSGNDTTNDGLTLITAFATLQHAADIVQAGDVVLVQDGTYAGFDLRNKNGSAVAPIVFQALGNNALINLPGPIRADGINIENADYVVIDGFVVQDTPFAGNGIRLVLSDHCIVRNCWCDNNGQRGIFTGFTDDILIEYNLCTNSVDEHGIYVSNSSDRPIIRFNECYGNRSIGIHMNGDLSIGGDGIISDAQVYGNILHDNNQSAGINMDGVENPVVYNNLIYNNHFAQGIALFQQDGAIVTSGAKIFNNTIIVPPDGRWGILLKDGANMNTEIYNNVIINQHAWRGCIAAESITQLTSDFNIVNDRMSASGDGSTITLSAWQALGLDANTQVSAPLEDIFSDPGSNNFQLTSSSQAIDVGTSLVNTLVNTDLLGNTRPQGIGYDIGAYELVMTSLPVELLSFEGALQAETVVLEWEIGQLFGVAGFEVEHAGDDLQWAKLGSLSSAANIPGTRRFEYLHSKPLAGKNYYRLKMIDMEEYAEYSPVVVVHITGLEKQINVYPNPSPALFTVDGILNSCDLQVRDASGRILLSKKSVDLPYQLDLIQLPAGSYFLTLKDEKGSVVQQKELIKTGG